MFSLGPFIFIFIFISFFTIKVLAVDPINSNTNTNYNTNVKVNVDEYDPVTAFNSFYFCKAAMCPYELLANWSCGVACDYHSSMENIFVYENSTIQSQGFAGYNSESNELIISFRGSSTLLNWITDFYFFPTAFPSSIDDYINNYSYLPKCNNCTVHAGFYEAFKGLTKSLMNDLAELLLKYPSSLTNRIIITGHSLGAALASFAAIQIKNFLLAQKELNRKIILYTFGSPRIGNLEFAEWVQSIFDSNDSGSASVVYRITHHSDPVPHLPPSWLLNFAHFGQEIWYNEDSSAYITCKYQGPGKDDKNCSDSTSIFINPNDHIYYLGLISHCLNDSPANMTSQFEPF